MWATFIVVFLLSVPALCLGNSCSPFQNVEHLLEDLVRNYSRCQKVVFSAFVDNSPLKLNKGDIIPFKDLKLNLGNGYSTSGVFTAPLRGTYYFQTTFLTFNDDELWVTIDLNGAIAGRANGKGHNTRHGTGTQTVILDLAVGDKVSVKCEGGHAIYGAQYSSFSGFLIN